MDPSDNAEWASPLDCLWEAPADFTTKRPLKALYEGAGFAVSGGDIQEFFQGTLRIPNISHADVTDEIWEMKAGEVDIERVHSLYRMLQETHQNDSNIADYLRLVMVSLYKHELSADIIRLFKERIRVQGPRVR